MAPRRYRYSKWRWRVLVRAFDLLGGIVFWFWRKIRPQPRWSAPRRILLVQLDHLGDGVLTTPMLPRLRSAYPDARIEVLASLSNREVFESDPHVDRVHLAERNWFERRASAWALSSAVLRLGWALRRHRYDLGIDVRGDVLTLLVLTLAGIPRRLGWSMGGGGFLLTDEAAWVPGRHEVESRLALLGRLGITSGEPVRVAIEVSEQARVRVGSRLHREWPDRSPRAPQEPAATHGRRVGTALLPLARGHRPAGFDPEWLHAGRFGADHPLLAVHLGAGMSAKLWPVRHWDALLGRFLADGWRVIVLGAEGDRVAGRQLATHANLRNWTGTLAVTETTALLERADLFIGADSGPAHLAAAAGVPSVVLFSGTNQVGQWRPYSRRSLVIRHKVGCGPCHQKVCPLQDHPCMNGLRPERVYRVAHRWWLRTLGIATPPTTVSV